MGTCLVSGSNRGRRREIALGLDPSASSVEANCCHTFAERLARRPSR